MFVVARYLGGVLIVVVAFVATWKYGYATAETDIANTYIVQLKKVNEREQELRNQVDTLATDLEAARAKSAVVRTIREKIPVYLPASSDCPALPDGFRVLHDAAASGELPKDPTAAPAPHGAGPTPQEAAATVTENYASCLADKVKLTYLQQYVKTACSNDSNSSRE